jgi:hypothetical protein
LLKGYDLVVVFLAEYVAVNQSVAIKVGVIMIFLSKLAPWFSVVALSVASAYAAVAAEPRSEVVIFVVPNEKIISDINSASVDMVVNIGGLQNTLLEVIKGVNPERVRVKFYPGILNVADGILLDWRMWPNFSGEVILEGASDGSSVLSGMVALPFEGWRLCDECDRSKNIFTYKLSANERVRFGNFVDAGSGLLDNESPRSELYQGHNRLNLASWPEGSWATISYRDNIAVISSPGLADFKKLSQKEPVWASGYWAQQWAHYSTYLQQDKLLNGEVAFAGRSLGSGIQSGGRFKIHNDPSLIAKNGDWALLTSSDTIFLSSNGGGPKGIGFSGGGYIIKAIHPRNLKINNLTLYGSKGDAVILDQSEDSVVSKVEISGGESSGISLSGVNNLVKACHIHDVGTTGVKVVGGDRSKLTAGNNIIRDSLIHDFGQRVQSYRAGVQIDGVGNKVIDNTISNAPHNGILVAGNEHQIIGNEIYNVVNATADAGALYTGRDWSRRGILIQGNYFHDIKPLIDGYVIAVYLDDEISGETISDNVFWDVDYAVMVGGGSWNRVINNIFINAKRGIHIDDRGLTWQHKMATDPDGYLIATSRQFVGNAVWMQKYPEFFAQLKDASKMPKGNLITGNIFYQTAEPYRIFLTGGSQNFQKIDQPIFLDVGEKIADKSPVGWGNLCARLRQFTPEANKLRGCMLNLK